MNNIFIKAILLVLVITSFLNFMARAQTNWTITGNTATTPGTNFIGTIDKKDLVISTNSKEAMRVDKSQNVGIGANSPKQKLDVNGNINIRTGFGLFMENHRVFKVDSANGNIFLGNGVAPNNTGFYNTATGSNVLFSNTSGIANTASGTSALYSNSTGSYNTSSGFTSLYSNTTGGENTATGAFALYSNTTGESNTATGEVALYLNTTGYSNTANGQVALRNNTSGFYNTASGAASLYNNTIGAYNTAGGVYSLYNNSTGLSNTTSGYGSLYTNTTGSGNTASGESSLYYNSTGAYNTALGLGAMYFNTSGDFNTAIGTDALYNNIDAFYNCAVGYLALAFSVAPGWNNTAVGSFAGPGDNLYNTISIGEEAFTSASNQARIGNSSTTSIGGYTDWTNISDGRVKKNIKQDVPGLTFINRLKPITYNLDLDAADKITQKPVRKDKDGKVVQPSSLEVSERNAKQQIVYTGFIAQDVEKAAKELNYDFSGVDAAKNDHDLYGLRYAAFVVPLVKAVQELSKSNDEKDAKINDLETRLSKLEAMMNIQSPATGIAQQTLDLNAAVLEQNVPNPFSTTTTIRYTLPPQYSSAQIVITDQNGNTVKQVNISGSGPGMTTLDVAGLSSGTYQYSLIVNGQKMDTRQMTLTK